MKPTTPASEIGFGILLFVFAIMMVFVAFVLAAMVEGGQAAEPWIG